MRATGSVVVDAPLQRIVDFILDPHGYPQADDKIVRIDILESRDDGVIRQRVRGRMRWRPLGSTLRMRVVPRLPERIDITTEPGSIGFPASLALRDFTGEFLFEPVDGGIRVTHTEDQAFKPTLAGRVAERLVSSWLRRHIAEREMPALKRLVEAG